MKYAGARNKSLPSPANSGWSRSAAVELYSPVALPGKCSLSRMCSFSSSFIFLSFRSIFLTLTLRETFLTVRPAGGLCTCVCFFICLYFNTLIARLTYLTRKRVPRQDRKNKSGLHVEADPEAGSNASRSKAGLCPCQKQGTVT